MQHAGATATGLSGMGTHPGGALPPERCAPASGVVDGPRGGGGGGAPAAAARRTASWPVAGWIGALLLGWVWWPGQGQAVAIPGMELANASGQACAVARELGSKGMRLFDLTPDAGVAALERAWEMCPTDADIGFNLALAHYQSARLERAADLWAQVLALQPDHRLALTNRAWTLFELGRDEEAHILAFSGLDQFPGDTALAHTKIYALFRLGRYLEAYDWISRAGLSGIRARKWREKAVSHVVENLWRGFRAGRTLGAVKEAVNLLVREYPTEAAFVAAKDQLVLAELDPGAEIPYPMPLPHETWAKTGPVDEDRELLDERIDALPPLPAWQKRTDAFALLAGVYRYRQLPGRHFADRDAQQMQRLLTRRGVFLEDANHLRLRLDGEAEGRVLQSDLAWLVAQGRINPNAVLLFFFSGQALPGPDGDLLLLPVDAAPDRLPGDGLSLRRLQESLATLPNRDVMVIIDACFDAQAGCVPQPAGSPPAKPDWERLSAGKSLLVSSRDGRWQPHGPGRQGQMTWWLLSGLLGAADGLGGASRDGWVDLREAATRAAEALQRQGQELWQGSLIPFRLTRTGGEQ
ncbi:MAG: caspase family protein [Magnetococcus sp. WYHC-3]